MAEGLSGFKVDQVSSQSSGYVNCAACGGVLPSPKDLDDIDELKEIAKTLFGVEDVANAPPFLVGILSTPRLG